MRALFLLLLLANLLFLAWSTWIAPPTEAIGGRPTPVSANPHAIRLLREAPLARELSEDATQTTAAGGGAADTSVNLACVSAGPYLEKTRAEAAAARLERLGYASRLRQSTDEVTVGQWVRIADLATPDDAANALAALKAAGLTDAYVVTEESPGTTISLGVFGEPARAQEVADKARKAGFNPVMSDRTRPALVYWLDVDRLANGGLPTLEDLQGGTAELPVGGRLELRACPETAAPQGTRPAP